jgi:hypothetical protein
LLEKSARAYPRSFGSRLSQSKAPAVRHAAEPNSSRSVCAFKSLAHVQDLYITFVAGNQRCRREADRDFIDCSSHRRGLRRIRAILDTCAARSPHDGSPRRDGHVHRRRVPSGGDRVSDLTTLPGACVRRRRRDHDQGARRRPVHALVPGEAYNCTRALCHHCSLRRRQPRDRRSRPRALRSHSHCLRPRSRRTCWFAFSAGAGVGVSRSPLRSALGREVGSSMAGICTIAR